MRKKSRVVALLLAMGMLFTGCGDSTDKQVDSEQPSKQSTSVEKESENQQTESEYPEYLNLDSAYPIIKDEYAGEIKLKVAVVLEDAAKEWDDLWLSKYLKEKYNLEFDVEVIRRSARDDKKTIMFSSGELPDIIWNFSLKPQEIFTYGEKEGMLLAVDEYIDETLTPNIAKYFADESITQAITSMDGHIYALPKLMDTTDEGSYSKIFINRAWLEELNIPMPKTLDEFTDALYKIKDADPAGVGSENLYPLSGRFAMSNSAFWLLNAFGYMTYDPFGIDPAIRDGEAVIPVYDMEIFEEYLKLWNQYYQDGIVSPDLFTIESAEVNAQVAAGQSAVYHQPTYVLGIDTFTDWEACYPLTSEWQEEPESIKPITVGVGGMVISAETEYPELCLRFTDIYYNNETDDCYALSCGPGENSEWNMGYLNEGYDPETNTYLEPEGVNFWDYLNNELCGMFPTFGAIGLIESQYHHFRCLGYEPSEEKSYDLTTGEGSYRASVAQNIMPYAVDAFPSLYFLDADTTNEMNNILTVIEPYVEEQVALFITGKRSLSETADFVEELEAMGIERLLEIYQQIYNK